MNDEDKITINDTCCVRVSITRIVLIFLLLLASRNKLIETFKKTCYTFNPLRHSKVFN
jgi:hypothetical protein